MDLDYSKQIRRITSWGLVIDLIQISDDSACNKKDIGTLRMGNQHDSSE
jgi:hypothetical protein